jgi:O-antigen/teichoic acid export membrane protein
VSSPEIAAPVPDRTAPGTEPTAPAPVRRALTMSFLNTLVGRVGTLAVGIALARLLSPADFGVYAVALVALNAMLSFNELGVSLALVRWRTDPREIAPTITTISLLSSAGLYAGTWFAAPAFAAALGAPDATGVIRLLCLAVLIDGSTAAATQLVNREFRQGTQLVVDTCNLVLASGTTIGLAVAGFGPWSLAWGALVGNTFSALVLFRLAALWPRPGFDRRRIRELLGFGLPLAGASLLVFAMLNIDYVLTGWLLGAVALGLYFQAFNLASWPVNMFSMVVRRVSFAAFAKVQDDPAQRHAALGRFVTLLAVATLPTCALLGLLALPLVTTLYGQRWAASAAALQFLAVLAAVRVAGELAHDYLAAAGHPRRTMWLQAGWLAALAAALPVGALADGIRGVAIAHAAVAVVVMLPAFVLTVCRTGVPVRTLTAGLARPVLGTALLIGAVLLVRWLTDPSLLQLALAGALGALLYLPVVWPLRRLLTTTSDIGHTGSPD